MKCCCAATARLELDCGWDAFHFCYVWGEHRSIRARARFVHSPPTTEVRDSSTGKQLSLFCLTAIGSAFGQQGLKRTLRFALRLSLSSIIGGVHHTNSCRLDDRGRKANWEERNLAFSLFCVRFCLTEINNSCCPLQRLQHWLYVQGGSASCNSLFLPVFAAPVCSKASTCRNLLTSFSTQFDVCFPVRGMTDC